MRYRVLKANGVNKPGDLIDVGNGVRNEKWMVDNGYWRPYSLELEEENQRLQNEILKRQLTVSSTIKDASKDITEEKEKLQKPEEIARTLSNDSTKQKVAAMFLREPGRSTYSCCSELDTLKVESPWSAVYQSWIDAYESDNKNNVETYFSKLRIKVRDYRASHSNLTH